MPKSHDAKPRNRDRRVKGQEQRGLKSAQSGRSRVKVILRRRLQEAQAFERNIVAVLAFEGKTWRYYERASSRECRRIKALADARLSSDTLARAA